MPPTFSELQEAADRARIALERDREIQDHARRQDEWMRQLIHNTPPPDHLCSDCWIHLRAQRGFTNPDLVQHGGHCEACGQTNADIYSYSTAPKPNQAPTVPPPRKAKPAPLPTPTPRPTVWQRIMSDETAIEGWPG